MRDAQILDDFRRAADGPGPASRGARLSAQIAEARKADEAPREPWPDWWRDATDSLIATRCRVLWVCVLHRNLFDSLRAFQARQRGRRLNLKSQECGPDWWMSQHCRDVAGLAGFDGDALQQRLRRTIERDGIDDVIGRLVKTEHRRR